MNDESQIASATRLPGSASRQRLAGRLLSNVALGLVFVFVLFPIVWLVQMSFRPDEDILGYQLLFTPTLAHYGALVESKGGSYVVLRSVEDARAWIARLRSK